MCMSIAKQLVLVYTAEPEGGAHSASCVCLFTPFCFVYLLVSKCCIEVILVCCRIAKFLIVHIYIFTFSLLPGDELLKS